MIERPLIVIYKTFFIGDGEISQDEKTIVIKIPQYLQVAQNSFYMIYRIYMLDNKLFIRELI